METHIIGLNKGKLLEFGTKHCMLEGKIPVQRPEGEVSGIREK